MFISDHILTKLYLEHNLYPIRLNFPQNHSTTDVGNTTRSPFPVFTPPPTKVKVNTTTTPSGMIIMFINFQYFHVVIAKFGLPF